MPGPYSAAHCVGAASPTPRRAARTFRQTVGRPALCGGVKTPPYDANRKRGMPLSRGQHICRPYKATKCSWCLILLSLRLPNQISKSFLLNFRKIFCFSIVKRLYLWYDADKNKDVPTRGLCALWGRLFCLPRELQRYVRSCDAFGIWEGAITRHGKLYRAQVPRRAVQPPI